jgi:hypothetical protein
MAHVLVLEMQSSVSSFELSLLAQDETILIQFGDLSDEIRRLAGKPEEILRQP